MSKDGGTEVQIERLAEVPCAQCGTRLDITALEPFSGVECPSCGNQDTVPARFGQFLLLNLISTGGMGGVYRARDESLGRLVAIKVMLQQLGANAEFVENFKREAQAAARLNHPHVAQIYSYGQVNGQPYIVMELVSGHRFDRLIESTPRGLDPALVLRVGVDIAEGLQAAEEIGLVHGDIKPENILLDEKRKAKLVDFGIASFADKAAAEGVWGSPYYIAPERARGRKSDGRSDIYSLGATLYHALAGRPPFDGATPIDVVKARLTKNPHALDGIRPELSKPLVQTLERMLAREPAQRHPTYASLLSDLRRNLQDAVATGGVRTLAASSGKRVTIKKKDPAVIVAAMGRNRQTHHGPRVVAPFPRVEEQLQIVRARRRRHSLVTGMIIGGLVLVAVVTIAIMTARAKQKAGEEARRSARALLLARGQAEAAHAAIAIAATNVLRDVAVFESLLAPAQQGLVEIETLVGDVPPGADAGTPLASARSIVEQLQAQAAAGHDARGRVPLIVAAADALLAGANQANGPEEIARREAELQEQQALLHEVDGVMQAALQQARSQARALATIQSSVRAQAAQRQVEAERRQAEQGRQEGIAAELAVVQGLAARGSDAAMRFDYRDVAREAKAAGLTLKTDEGKAALENLLDRYARLEGLKGFLIQELGKAPFAWGWVRPGGTREDILGADSNGIKLHRRTVPWGDLAFTQFLAIVDHCIKDSKATRSTLGEQYLATALHCANLGNADLARKYRDKALETSAALRRTVDQVMPLN